MKSSIVIVFFSALLMGWSGRTLYESKQTAAQESNEAKWAKTELSSLHLKMQALSNDMIVTAYVADNHEDETSRKEARAKYNFELMPRYNQAVTDILKAGGTARFTKGIYGSDSKTK